MDKINRFLVTGLLVYSGIFLLQSAQAAIRLPSLIGNNMVLQQKTEILVWGWADTGEIVSVNAGWFPSPVTVTTSADGTWKAVLRTPKAGGPYNMSITGRDYSITIKNIMIGEVWVCSGQSNMEFTMRGLGGWANYPAEVKQEVAQENYNNVRLFTVQRDTSAKPLSFCKGNWLTPDTNTVNDFSATAWFFGAYLSKKLGVPVGLISAAWGGTPAEVWAPLASIEAEPDLGYYLKSNNGSQWWPGTAGVLFNAMIHPLLNYTVKGAIWYQGESNVKDAKLYTKLFQTMISAWREAWGKSDMPFYFVQIAPFEYEEPFNGALLREAQLKSLLLSNTGMAVTMDIAGDVTDIHPKNKLDVGKRLALWALNKTYGQETVSFSGPVYKEMKIEGSSIRIAFQYADDGLKLSDPKENNFSVAGSDHVFYPATVRITGSEIVVSSPEVKQPQAVRYAFTNTTTATLFGMAGLPASSFRTDHWDIIKETIVLASAFDPFTKALSYELRTQARESDILYQFNRKPDKNSPRYLSPIPAGKSGTLFAVVSREGYLSEMVHQWRIMANKAIGVAPVYKNTFSERYPAGGNYGLTDGIMGTARFQDGSWQGFEGSDLDVVIDLGKEIPVGIIKSNFLSANSDWIFLPANVTVQVSSDGATYTTVGKKQFSSDKEVKGSLIQSVSVIVKSKIRFIKLVAANQGTCPAWHPGAGNKAWLFVDEITVE